MCTIYNNIKSLCDERGVKPGRMCVELGMSKSILTGLKNGTKKNIQTDTAQKIADYFGVTVDRVLGTEKAPATEGEGEKDALIKAVREITDKDTALAVFDELSKKMRELM